MTPMQPGLPVVVIGAGPTGLSAAANLTERGLPAVVVEQGDTPAAAVRQWGHVRLFSTWSDLVDPAARRLLTAQGWREPDPGRCPTGAEWAARYLDPLAAALGGAVRLGTRVVGVSREGRDRVVDTARAHRPFTVRLRLASGAEEVLAARAVIDASGTWTSPNPLGGDGLPALGEHAAGHRIGYRVPDLSDPVVRARHAGRRTAVVGSGHSALTALVELAALAREEPGTRATWVLRRAQTGQAFGGGSADRLPARGALGERAEEAVRSGVIDVVTGLAVRRVEETPEGLVLVGGTGAEYAATGPVDEVLALTGFRPDLSWLSEIRLGLDPTLQAPLHLAPMIDPNVHSCGTVYPHGAAELSHPEADFYAVGMKSYGRAPTFLALTGYEQVRSVVAALAGDHEAAGRVELTLPETGVCSGTGLPAEEETAQETAGGGCCGPAPSATADAEALGLSPVRHAGA